MKDEVKRQRALGGASHTLKGKVMPSWDIVLHDEELHNGYVVFD